MEQMRTIRTPAAAFQPSPTNTTSYEEKKKKRDLSEAALDDDEHRSNGGSNKNNPKRPLSSYNYFFQYERARILIAAASSFSTGSQARPPVIVPGTLTPSIVLSLLENNPFYSDRKKRVHRKSHQLVSFQDLVKRISAAWKVLDGHTRGVFEELSKADKARYREEKKKRRASGGGGGGDEKKSSKQENGATTKKAKLFSCPSLPAVEVAAPGLFPPSSSSMRLLSVGDLSVSGSADMNVTANREEPRRKAQAAIQSSSSENDGERQEIRILTDALVLTDDLGLMIQPDPLPPFPSCFAFFASYSHSPSCTTRSSPLAVEDNELRDFLSQLDFERSGH